METSGKSKTIMKLKEQLYFHEWAKYSINQQKNLSSMLCDSIWDEFDWSRDRKELFQKIALIFFGRPDDIEEDDYGLPEDKKSLVSDIMGKCYTHSFNKCKIRIGIIFVTVYMDKDSQTIVPLIRVMSLPEKEAERHTRGNVCIDHLGRVYKNWADYEENNTWDSCWLSFPDTCHYSGNLKVRFLDQSSRGKVLQVIDKAASVTGLGSSCTMLAGCVLAFNPLTMPFGLGLITASTIVGAPAAVYGTGRSVQTLIDRGKKEQTNNPFKSAEARQAWLTTAAGIVSVGALSSAKLLTSAARTGNVLSSSTRFICTGINVSSLSLSGCSVMNSIYELSKKDKVTSSDLLELSVSLFLFAHTVVSFKTANAIIKEAQEIEIMKMKQDVLSELHKKYDAFRMGIEEAFEGVSSQSKELSQMEGLGKFIREIKKIDNVNEFFQHFNVDKSGLFQIHNELTISPKSFSTLTGTEQKKLIDLSMKLEANEISLKKFKKFTRSIAKKTDITINRSQTHQYLQDRYNVKNHQNIKIGSGTLRGASEPEIKKLANVVKNYFNNGDKDYMAVADRMAEKMGITNVNDYCDAGEFAVRQIRLEINERMKENPNPERIGGTAKDFYKEQVIKDYLSNDAKFNNTVKSFSKLCEDPQVLGNKKLGSCMKAANQFDKHREGRKSEGSIVKKLQNPRNNVKKDVIPKQTISNNTSVLNTNVGVQKSGIPGSENTGFEPCEIMTTAIAIAKKMEIPIKILFDWVLKYIKQRCHNERTETDKVSSFLKFIEYKITHSVKIQHNMIIENCDDYNSVLPQEDENNNFSPETYFEIAVEVAGGSISFVTWVQYDYEIMCSCYSNEYGPVAIRFINMKDGMSVTVILYNLTEGSETTLFFSKSNFTNP